VHGYLLFGQYLFYYCHNIHYFGDFDVCGGAIVVSLTVVVTAHAQNKKQNPCSVSAAGKSKAL